MDKNLTFSETTLSWLQLLTVYNIDFQMSLVILRPEFTAYMTLLFARSKGTSNSMCKNLNMLSNSVLPIFSNINERHHPFIYPIIQIQNLLIINGMNALFKHSSDHRLSSISPSVSSRILSIITTTVIVQITLSY